MADSPPPAYKVKRQGSQWHKVICPECRKDDPEEGYWFSQWYHEPEPMTQADLDGWSEGRGVSCDSCCKELVR